MPWPPSAWLDKRLSGFMGYEDRYFPESSSGQRGSSSNASFARAAPDVCSTAMFLRRLRAGPRRWVSISARFSWLQEEVGRYEFMSYLCPVFWPRRAMGWRLAPTKRLARHHLSCAPLMKAGVLGMAVFGGRLAREARERGWPRKMASNRLWSGCFWRKWPWGASGMGFLGGNIVLGRPERLFLGKMSFEAAGKGFFS